MIKTGFFTEKNEDLILWPYHPAVGHILQLLCQFVLRLISAFPWQMTVGQIIDLDEGIQVESCC